MEFVLELLFDLILEGSIELGTSRKVPMVLRILALAILVLVFGGLVVVLAVIAVNLWQEDKVVNSILFVVIDIIFVAVIIWGVRKKIVEHNK